MQSTLIAGDTLDFLTTVPDYPPADGWTLKFRLVPQVSGSALTFNASTEGTDYRVSVGPATTAAWAAGDYSWTSYVEKSGARHTVESGLVEIKPDPAVMAAGTDMRSAARKVLDGLMALYESNSVSQGLVSEYEIAGRRMKFRDTADLISQIGYWRSEVAKEDRAEKLRAGRDTGATLRVMM